jgi:hypothetical protein
MSRRNQSHSNILTTTTAPEVTSEVDSQATPISNSTHHDKQRLTGTLIGRLKTRQKFITTHILHNLMKTQYQKSRPVSWESSQT